MSQPGAPVAIGRWLAISASVVVAAVIVTAVVAIGPPSMQRQAKLDGKRVQQLEAISNSIDSYVNLHDVLPPSLAVLDGAGQWLKVTDPKDGSPYLYATTGARTYRVCAIFATSSSTSDEDNAWMARNWGHAAGRQCFERKAKPVNDR